MLLKKRYVWLLGVCTVFLTVFSFFIVWNKINRVAKAQMFASRDQNVEILALKNVIASYQKSAGKAALPPRLVTISCSQKLGIVKEVKKVHFDSGFPLYNPSMIEAENGNYHLFFRHDEPQDNWRTIPFYSYIGYAELDQTFTPTKVIEKLDTKSRFSEDPRIVKVGKDFFLSWNDRLDSNVPSRAIHSGKWNPKTGAFDYITNLDQHIRLVEKNWVPFERWEKNTPYLSFVYAIQPHKILSVPHPEKNEVDHLISQNNAALTKLSWNRHWGVIGGGTTARLVNGEYISFFHSSFREPDGIIWYVMGAYTFQAEPPYAITSISSFPILFPGIYTSDFLNTADRSKRILYPAGLAVEQKGNKTLLHVSCGENDSAIKIVTIDYETLRKTMKPL